MGGAGAIGGAPGIAAASAAVGAFGIPAASVGPTAAPVPSNGPSAAWQQRGAWFDASQVMFAPGAQVQNAEVRFATEHDFRVALTNVDVADDARKIRRPVPCPAKQAHAAPPASSVVQQVANAYSAYRTS